MTDTNVNGSKDAAAAADRPAEIEHFLNLNVILSSLVDFIRPETFVAQDELQTFNELKNKSLREATSKRNKIQQNQKGKTASSPLDIVDAELIRSTSGIYRFLAQHHKNHQSSTTKKAKTSVSREELLRRLHNKMPHRQQTTENGIDQSTKRKRPKDKSDDRKKRTRLPTIEKGPKSSKETEESIKSEDTSSTTIPTQLTFGRFEFNIEDNSNKQKNRKKAPTKRKQLINTLKQVESEQNELARLREENPEEGKEVLRSKHWQTALAKAKGEKIRDNAQMLRKTLKKESKRRQRSAKKWQHNKAETEKRQKEKQDKRTANLLKRKDDKKAKLKKRLIKKGRILS